MRRFERSNYCLAPIATVHAAAACFCRLHQNHGNSLDYLSMHDLELRDGDYGLKVEHTAAGSAEGGVEIVLMPATSFEGGIIPPRQAPGRTGHRLDGQPKPAQETLEPHC